MIRVFNWSKVAKEVEFLASCLNFEVVSIRYDDEDRLLVYKEMDRPGYPKSGNEYFVEHLKELFDEKGVMYKES